MSALQSSPKSYIRENSVWRILTQEGTVDDQLDQILEVDLDIWGVRGNGRSYNFDEMLPHVPHVALAQALYGIYMSCCTGELHWSVADIPPEWCCRLFRVRVFGEPAFTLACRREMHAVVSWMVEQCPNEPLVFGCALRDGDTALHMAIRRCQWEWAKWLVTVGCCRYSKNEGGETPLSLMAPHGDYVHLLRHESVEWYNCLHDALLVSTDAAWAAFLLDEGADPNQPGLYARPVGVLDTLARCGMDMNLSPLPCGLTPAHWRILYVHGRVPRDWSRVLRVFEREGSTEWVAFLHRFSSGDPLTWIPPEYKSYLNGRQCITSETKTYVERIQNEI
jgi:hypothetical protein|tara:strand:- start:6542 stop:7546 length:1005 start_codon:yes stop_codon:yes gene_type:complete